VIALAAIGADPVRAVNFPKAFKERLGKGWTGFFGKTPVFPDTGGYVAPPMDGIWARANAVREFRNIAQSRRDIGA